jgi:hypothetical protein
MALLNQVVNRQQKILRPLVLPPQKTRLKAEVKFDSDIPKFGMDPQGAMVSANAPDSMLKLPELGKAPVATQQAETPHEATANVAGTGQDHPSIVSVPAIPIPLYSQIAIPAVRSVPAETALESAAKPGPEPARDSGNGKAESASPGGPGMVVGSTPPTAAAPKQFRIERPKTGRYDVAITIAQSAIPGADGLMIGRPVYTVYIPMATAKDWILQYALRENAGAARPRNGTVISLDDPVPITAPYAFVLLRPITRYNGGGRYGFVHGSITATGKLEGLRIVGEAGIPGGGFDDAVEFLRSLGQWEFIPAAKDGVPVATEVLLCIPVGGN